MSARLDRLKPDSRGIAKILTSAEVEADLGKRALRVADQVEGAGVRVDGVPGRIDLPVTVTVTATGARGRARVILDHPSGQAVEAKHGLLSAGIDAARDRL